MTCGDTAEQWAPTLGTSIWTGSINSDACVMLLTKTNWLAVVNVGAIALVGTWTVNGGQLLVNVAIGGITYSIALNGSCTGSSVNSGSGGAEDVFRTVHSMTVTRIV